MASTNEFPELNFSMLFDPDFDFAVHCSTDAQALHFIREIRRQYPKNAWDHEYTRWDDAGGQLAYAPYLNRGRRMTWDGVDRYINRGFTIIEFEDLLPIETDIEESDQSINTLFGGLA